MISKILNADWGPLPPLLMTAVVIGTGVAVAYW
jgi:hypothetical protein